MLENLNKLRIYGKTISKRTNSELKYSEILLRKYFNKFLSKDEQKKYELYLINSVVAVAATNIMFMEYKDLVGKEFENAHELSTLLTAVIEFEDTLIDELGAKPGHIKVLFENPSGFAPENNLEKLTQALLVDAINLIPSKYINRQNQYICELSTAELKSLHQTDKDLTPEDLKQMAFDKGKLFPVLAYPYNPEMPEEDFKALQHMGTWVKYYDDYVDLQKDSNEGRFTIFNHPESKDNAMKFVEDYGKEVFAMFRNLNYPKDRVEDFLFHLYFLTISFKKYYEFLNTFSFLKGLNERHPKFAIFTIVIATLLGMPEILNYK